MQDAQDPSDRNIQTSYNQSNGEGKTLKVQLHEEWVEVLGDELSRPHMVNLKKFLLREKQNGKVIFPAGQDIFAAFNETPFSSVKVVIIGQDPYHGDGQAHGLCFSVKPGITVPPSLKNIYKELATDLGLPTPDHGFLGAWAKQGVLLLNSVLTVERGRAASHQNQGWELFTDRAIHELNQRRKHLVFILWGSYAQKKGLKIDRDRHMVLASPHPSPLSSHRGFFGSRPFSQTNRYLISHARKPIDWMLPASPAK